MASTRPERCLVLWDVDHTLIDNGGVSKEIYLLAFEHLSGSPPDQRPRTGGRTDPLIMRDLWLAHGLDREAFDWQAAYRALVSAGEAKSSELRARGHALPGALAVLRRLAHDEFVVQSALTGNVRENARVKLAAFGLDEYLDLEVGAFGSDDDVRARLVPVAQARADHKYGAAPAGRTAVLVGDTPRDVEAGARGGAHVLGVATGSTTERELLDAGADEVLPGLEDTDAVMAAVHRLGRRAVRPLPVA